MKQYVTIKSLKVKKYESKQNNIFLNNHMTIFECAGFGSYEKPLEAKDMMHIVEETINCHEILNVKRLIIMINQLKLRMKCTLMKC